METEKKGTRGGRRPGAGRKKFVCKQYGFKAPRDIVEILEAQPKKTKFILDALRAFHARCLKETKKDA